MPMRMMGRYAPAVPPLKRARALCGAEKRVLVLVGLAPCAQAGAGAAVSGRSAV